MALSIVDGAPVDELWLDNMPSSFYFNMDEFWAHPPADLSQAQDALLGPTNDGNMDGNLLDLTDFSTSTGNCWDDTCNLFAPLLPTSPITTITSETPSPTLLPSPFPSTDSETEIVCLSTPQNSSATGRRRGTSRRIPHNTVEKHYRNTVNAALQRLQRTVPRFASPGHDSDGLEAVRQPTKTAVLMGAVEYIRELERERDALREERGTLRNVARTSEMLLERVALRDNFSTVA